MINRVRVNPRDEAPLQGGRADTAGSPTQTNNLSKPGGGNVTDRESNPHPLGASSGDSTTHLKRSAVLSATGIHR